MSTANTPQPSPFRQALDLLLKETQITPQYYSRCIDDHIEHLKGQQVIGGGDPAEAEVFRELATSAQLDRDTFVTVVELLFPGD